MTILLPMVVMRGGHRQIGTMRVDRRVTGRMTGLHRRIKGGPMITRRHRHRRIATEIMIEIVITTATGMANHITTCTQHQELL